MKRVTIYTESNKPDCIQLLPAGWIDQLEGVTISTTEKPNMWARPTIQIESLFTHKTYEFQAVQLEKIEANRVLLSGQLASPSGIFARTELYYIILD